MGEGRSNQQKQFSLMVQTVEQIDLIADRMRWDKSTVVEAAVEDLYKKIFVVPAETSSQEAVAVLQREG